ncbi:MAG: EscU/YscU/HrcU family type III secretion system export apparatus switch protein [Rhodobacteraceae bacterium]|nr:EscU/YscU/HrcU family type III secretion system export apparatus switch protein [Paracoccaceae bacterium]
MSAGQEDDGAGPREHDPTPKRLEDARARGDVAVSQELLSAAALAACVLALAAWLPAALPAFGAALQGALEGGGGGGGGPLLAATLRLAAPLLLAPVLAVLLAAVLQHAVVWAPERIAPRLSRIDPLAQARQRFGPEGIADFLRAALKFALVLVALVWLARRHAPDIATAAGLAPGQAAVLMARVARDFVVATALLALLAGGADLLWRRHRHRVRLRMSRQDLVEEHRESEGDPAIRARRRRRAEELARNRMLRDVPGATVVIVNPTHYAVALSWRRGDRGAPVCVAKGVDELALTIRRIAAGAGVPVLHDPATARALHATVDVGHPVRPEHFRAVAAAIRFAERMRRRAGRPA